MCALPPAVCPPRLQTERRSSTRRSPPATTPRGRPSRPVRTRKPVCSPERTRTLPPPPRSLRAPFPDATSPFTPRLTNIARAVKEFLEKNYNEETAQDGARLACRALLEVVEAGGKNIEIAVLRRGQPLQMMSEDDVEAMCTAIEAEKAAAEAAKKPAVQQ